MKKGYDYMHTDNTIKFNFWQEIPVKAAVSALACLRVGFERIRHSRQARIASWVILAVLVLTLEWLIAARVEHSRAQALYSERVEQFKADFLDQQDAARRKMPIDPIAAQREWDIDETAKVLYGIKSNSETDLRTYCWAAFNRVDIKTGEFRDVDSLAEVYAKPGQFMGYRDTNPVLKDLRKIAEEEYNIWKNGKERPCDVTKVFIYWTPEKVMLLEQIGDMVHTWRYRQ